MRKMLITLLLAALLAAGCGQASATPEADTTPVPEFFTIEGWQPADDEEAIIEQVVAVPVFASALTGEWEAFAWPEDEAGGDLWGIEFVRFEDDEEEFIGFVVLDAQTGEVVEWDINKPLTPEARAAYEARVTELVLSDPEVEMLLGDPSAWDQSIEREGDLWIMSFQRGIEEIAVLVYEEDEDALFLEEIIDESQLSAQEAEAFARDEAVALAWAAEGIDDALGDTDDWTTYVENQGESVFSVSFVSGEETLFYALVDIDAGTVLESSSP